MDYEKAMIIDESAIDLECTNQAVLMIKITRLEAELKMTEDTVREKRDLVKAEIDKEIRTNPKKFGIEKVTETSIQSAIFSHDKYKKVSKEYIDASFEAKCAVGAVRACDQRKSMLETLSRLHGQNYFAGPNIPHDLTKLKQEREKKTEVGVGTRLRRG